MDAFVGSSTGVIKGVSLTDNSCTNLNFSPTLTKQDENVALCWLQQGADDDDDQTAFLCASMNRQLKLCQAGSAAKVETLFTCSGGQGRISGLEMTNGNILTGVESGLIKSWSLDGEDKKLDLSVGQNLCKMRVSTSNPNLIATGGKENALKVWDLQAEDPTKPIFASKNVRNDWLELRVPIWESDVRFLENDSLISTCTGNHFVRLYDRRLECRRPAVQIDWSDHPFTAMSLTCNERQVIVGSSRGFMGLFDLRSPGKLVHAFKGFAGSISAIEAHHTEPYVVSCGLDRFVLVHHVQNKKMLHKVYCKAHLNTLLLRKDLSILDRVKTENASSDSEAENDEHLDEPVKTEATSDDLWAKMVPIKGKAKRKVDNEGAIVRLKKRKCKSSLLKRKADGNQQGLLVETALLSEPEKKSRTFQDGRKQSDKRRPLKRKIKEEQVEN